MSTKLVDQKLKWLIIGLFTGIIISMFFPEFFVGNRFYQESRNTSSENSKSINFAEYSTWPLFLTDPTFDLKTWQKHCWNQSTPFPSDDRQTYLKKNHTNYAVCRDIVSLLHSLYQVKTTIGQVQYPAEFAEKIRTMFHDDADLFAQALEQKLHFVINKYSFEHTVYNQIRGRRAIQPTEVPIEQYVNETIKKSSQICDLCNYQKMTAIDYFGRMESEHAYSASDVFKFDEWHSLFMSRQHDITKLTLEELKDVFTLAWKWIRAVYKRSSKHRFASILWNNFPHESASKVHPHIHATVHTEHYYGQFESLRFAAERYYRDFQQENYFRAIQDVHMAFNLTISLNGLTVLVPITSQKEFDLILFAENFDERVVEVIYKIVQGYFHKLGQYSFSSCLYLPMLSSNIDDHGLTPVYYRIIPHGRSSNLLSIYNVNKLPSDIYREVINWF